MKMRWLALGFLQVAFLALAGSAMTVAAAEASIASQRYDAVELTYDTASNNAFATASASISSGARVNHLIGINTRTNRALSAHVAGRDWLVAPNTGGTTLVADDLVSKRVADRAPVATGQHNVVLHGDADGFVGASVEDVAAAVRADPSYGGQPICLLSCNSAANGSAQALANELGVSVMAPTGRVGVPRPPAVPFIGIEPGTHWRWFLPGVNR